MSVILELSVFPLDNNAILSRFVAKSISIIKESGLPYSLGTLSACIEGEWDNVMDVVSGPEVCDPHEQPGRRYLTLPGMVQGGAN